MSASTIAASPPPAAGITAIAAELTRMSAETRFVPSLVQIANTIERGDGEFDTGLVAEPRFLRDERGRVVGIEVVAS